MQRSKARLPSNVKAKSDATKYYQGSRRRLTTTYSEMCLIFLKKSANPRDRYDVNSIIEGITFAFDYNKIRFRYNNFNIESNI